MSYYHEFTPGFNWYYVLAVVFLVVMGFLGSKMKGKQRLHTSERTLAIAAAFFSIIMFFMVMIESGDGIVQVLDNHLTKGDSPAWSVIFAPGAAIFMALAYGWIIYNFGVICGRIKGSK